MAKWFVEPGTVSGVLKSAGGTYDSLVEQIYGSGGGLWDSRAESLVGAAGDDGIVAGAFAGLAHDQLCTANSALKKYYDLLQATHDAVKAYLEGHRDMAASIVASAGKAMNIEGGNPYE